MRKLRLRNEAIYTRLNAWPGWNSGLTSYIVLKTHSTHSPRCPLVPRSTISHPSSHSPATFSVSASSCALGHTSLQPCCSPHITHLNSPLSAQNYQELLITNGWSPTSASCIQDSPLSAFHVCLLLCMSYIPATQSDCRSLQMLHVPPPCACLCWLFSLKCFPSLPGSVLLTVQDWAGLGGHIHGDMRLLLLQGPSSAHPISFWLAFLCLPRTYIILCDSLWCITSWECYWLDMSVSQWLLDLRDSVIIFVSQGPHSGPGAHWC